MVAGTLALPETRAEIKRLSREIEELKKRLPDAKA